MAGVEVRAACFEVCGKNVFDLLKNGEKLEVREDSSGTVQVPPARELRCPSWRRLRLFGGFRRRCTQPHWRQPPPWELQGGFRRPGCRCRRRRWR